MRPAFNDLELDRTAGKYRVKAAGTVRGDRSIYAGRYPFGTTHSTIDSVVAFDADGRIISTFPNAKAATAALDHVHDQGGGS